jgi:lysophospholipase
MADSDDSRRLIPPGAVFSTFAAADGWPLRRMDWRPDDGGPARGRLLFAGGRGDFIEKYLETYRWWHGRGWTVTAFDWRGQGRSRRDGESGSADFALRARDLAGLIAAWRAEGGGRHVAVGHSMGGHLLLRTLIEAKPALDAAVLVAPMLLVNSAPVPAWLAPRLCAAMVRAGRGDRTVWRPPAAVPVGSQRQRFLTHSVERYADELWWWGEAPAFSIGTPSWRWIGESYRSARASFTPARLGAVEVPILLLAAEKDRLVSTAAIRRAARLLPHATLHLYPDSAHEILRETDAVRRDALARIDAFLDEHAR